MEKIGEAHFEKDEVFEFATNWQGIELSISYCPRWLCSDGDELITQHIEIRSAGKAVLPITQTGYRSCFLMGADVLEEYEHDLVRFILTWLDEAAKTKQWKVHMERSRQPDLFG